jgi:hypothetical protein
MVMSALNLNKISRDVSEEMKQMIIGNDGKVYKRDVKEALRNSVQYYKSSRGIHSMGGNMAEVIENVSTSVLFRGLKTNRNTQVFWTGGTGMAADNIMVVAEGNISVETNEINKLLEKGEKTSKEQNRETVSEIENILDRGNT